MVVDVVPLYLWLIDHAMSLCVKCISFFSRPNSWLDPLFCYGVKHTLQHKDLYAHPPPADSEYLLNRFNKLVN